MVHIDRIYTRSGDHGETSLGNGDRVSKLHPRIIAGGAIDETNCAIGTAIAAGNIDELEELLRSIQQLLFDIGADLCVPIPTHEPDPLPVRTNNSQVAQLEALIDRFTARLQPLRSFILPGGTAAAASLHLARAICRRAELDVLKLQATEPINPMIVIALNRLSDLLFVLARIANQDGRLDVLWSPGRGLKAGDAQPGSV
ncbi:MAG: cob(I)yrinic acid a,c-diamide adenosyltransferase [Planctomycetota bacterium]